MDVTNEMSRIAASHEVDGEPRTADLLRRARLEILSLRAQLAELKSLQTTNTPD